jgi:hypothetical protein
VPFCLVLIDLNAGIRDLIEDLEIFHGFSELQRNQNRDGRRREYQRAERITKTRIAMLPTTLIFSVLCILRAVLSATLPGQLDLKRNLTSRDVQNTWIELEQVTSDTSGFKRMAYLHKDGSFEIGNISEGEYILTVNSIDYNLLPFKARVEVTQDDSITAYLIQATSKWEIKGQQIPLPFQIIANPAYPERGYIRERTPSIFKSGPIATVANNPLYLFAALLGLLVIGAPYLMEKFDPETAKAMREERQARHSKPTKAALEATQKLQSIGTESESEAHAEVAATKSSVKKRKN